MIKDKNFLKGKKEELNELKKKFSSNNTFKENLDLLEDAICLKEKVFFYLKELGEKINKHL